jgi:hypothetical protein
MLHTEHTWHWTSWVKTAGETENYEKNKNKITEYHWQQANKERGIS